MPKLSIPDTKLNILETGYQLISQKGFTSVGLNELLKEAKIPKGSFYHYFSSKEAFGQELIQYYFERYQQRLCQLEQQPISEQEKLIRYFREWQNTQNIDNPTDKCLVVKLSAEISDLSDAMRAELYEGYRKIIDWLTQQITLCQKAQPITESIDPNQLAKNWYFAWVGASLIAKLGKSNMPLNNVWDMTIGQFIKQVTGK